jgi:hypothetical protein
MRLKPMLVLVPITVATGVAVPVLRITPEASARPVPQTAPAPRVSLDATAGGQELLSGRELGSFRSCVLLARRRAQERDRRGRLPTLPRLRRLAAALRDPRRPKNEIPSRRQRDPRPPRARPRAPAPVDRLRRVRGRRVQDPRDAARSTRTTTASEILLIRTAREPTVIHAALYEFPKPTRRTSGGWTYFGAVSRSACLAKEGS